MVSASSSSPIIPPYGGQVSAKIEPLSTDHELREKAQELESGGGRGLAYYVSGAATKALSGLAMVGSGIVKTAAKDVRMAAEWLTPRALETAGEGVKKVIEASISTSYGSVEGKNLKNDNK